MAIRSSSVLAPEPEKITKTKSRLTYGTPCSNRYFGPAWEYTNSLWIIFCEAQARGMQGIVIRRSLKATERPKNYRLP